MAIDQVSVCIPIRDEAPTIGPIVACLAQLRASGVIDELVVVDDRSTDGGGAVAARAGATVIENERTPGKGGALRSAVEATAGDVVVFLDGDVTNFDERFVTELLRPLSHPSVALVKPRYERTLHGRPGEGGRVTELVARPLLGAFFPELAGLAQPLAGESAVRRAVLDKVVLADGYGIEIGLLLDAYAIRGIDGIAEVHLGERHHRNRPLAELRPIADAVIAAVLERAGAAPMARAALLR